MELGYTIRIFQERAKHNCLGCTTNNHKNGRGGGGYISYPPMEWNWNKESIYCN